MSAGESVVSFSVMKRVDEELLSLQEEGEYKRLQRKWFGPSA